MKIVRNLILIVFSLASTVALADDDFGCTKKLDMLLIDINL